MSIGGFGVGNQGFPTGEAISQSDSSSQITEKQEGFAPLETAEKQLQESAKMPTQYQKTLVGVSVPQAQVPKDSGALYAILSALTPQVAKNALAKLGSAISAGSEKIFNPSAALAHLKSSVHNNSVGKFFSETFLE